MTTRAEILRNIKKYRADNGLNDPKITKLLDAIVVQWSYISFGLFLFGMLFGYSLGAHT